MRGPAYIIWITTTATGASSLTRRLQWAVETFFCCHLFSRQVFDGRQQPLGKWQIPPPSQKINDQLSFDGQRRLRWKWWPSHFKAKIPIVLILRVENSSVWIFAIIWLQNRFGSLDHWPSLTCDLNSRLRHNNGRYCVLGQLSFKVGDRLVTFRVFNNPCYPLEL